MLLLVVVVFIISALINCAADCLFKRASMNFTWFDFLLGSFLYMVTIPTWLWILKNGKFATLVSLGIAMQLVMLTFIGWFFFKESLSVREMIGIGLVILAVLMFYK